MHDPFQSVVGEIFVEGEREKYLEFFLTQKLQSFEFAECWIDEF